MDTNVPGRKILDVSLSRYWLIYYQNFPYVSFQTSITAEPDQHGRSRKIKSKITVALKDVTIEDSPNRLGLPEPHSGIHFKKIAFLSIPSRKQEFFLILCRIIFKEVSNEKYELWNCWQQCWLIHEFIRRLLQRSFCC